MEYYCGIDVSLEQSSVCVVDASGSIATVASGPDASIADALLAARSALHREFQG